MSDERLRGALEQLGTHGVVADPISLKKHHVQGYISEVYTVASSVGHLVIHIVKISPAQEHLRAWEKLAPLSNLLRGAEIPVSEVLFSHRFATHYIVVQRLLEGENAGSRDIHDDDFTDTWREPVKEYQDQVISTAARLHRIPVSGFGWLRLKGDTLAGEHPTWEAFLNAEIPIWVAAIQGAERIRGTEGSGFLERVNRFAGEVLPELAYAGAPAIVHGDLTNPSNILCKDGRITGIIDWEFAIAADPAWEFHYKNPYSLEEYFHYVPNMSEADRTLFRRRTEIYGYLPFLLWLYITSWDPNGSLYRSSRSILERRLTERGRPL